MAKPLGRRFWAVWTGSAVSYLGEGLLFGAVPVLAASLTRDARLISVTDALQQAGWLLLGLVSGVVADRLPRLSIMWVANAARALFAGVFAALVAAGDASMPLIYGLGFLLGLAAPFFDNASSAVLPELVPPAEFQRANSLTQMALALAANLLGPVVGTATYVIWPAAPFGFAALAYAAGALVTAVVSRRAPGRAAHTGDVGPLQLVRDGLSYLLHHRVLRTLATAVGVVNFVTSAAIAVLVLYVLQLLHLPESAYGLVMASFAAGALLGAVLTARFTVRIGERRSVLVALAMFGLSTVVLGVWPQVVVSFAAFALVGFFSMVWNITVNSYRQRIVPLDLLGRVTSVFRMLAFLAMPLGALGGGLIAHAVGLRATYVAGGVLLLITTVLVLRPLREMPNAPAGAESVG
ncbi:MAG: MFS transporter [Actinobacteria bacterium HGW-Actinobacteria-5]|nr:MAG: MFS transporter [Actinobacteria bacterium HGW-Actinobacteria-5]